MGAVKDKTISLFKTKQSRIIVNQHVSTMCMREEGRGGVERNHEIKKQLEDNIIKNVRNLFRLKKRY